MNGSSQFLVIYPIGLDIFGFLIKLDIHLLLKTSKKLTLASKIQIPRVVFTSVSTVSGPLGYRSQNKNEKQNLKNELIFAPKISG